jgi:hypothetical protein
MTRMGANALFNERVQTRVLQAIGRCTRSLEDFSAVVVSGEDVSNYLADRQRRKYLHPELQAELDFGIEQSQATTPVNLIENFDIFLKNDVDWEVANNQILAKRAAAIQQPLPALDELQGIVACEIEFQGRLWQSDFEAALSAAERVLTKLSAPELRGYRALWHYLAGSAAWLGSQGSALSGLAAKARGSLCSSQNGGKGHTLARRTVSLSDAGRGCPIREYLSVLQLERVESILERLGNLHDRKYDAREQEIISGLASTEKGPFERSHVLLGEILGYAAGNREVDASPDPWWIIGNICMVFEDHAGALPTSTLAATKARQASTHPDWMRANVSECVGTEIYPVLVTPVTRAEDGALPHLGHVLYWSLADFRGWAKTALATLRELRRTFSEPGDLVWRSQAAEVFERHGLDAPSLLRKLKESAASDVFRRS